VFVDLMMIKSAKNAEVSKRNKKSLDASSSAIISTAYIDSTKDKPA
jgi:hypothetical protein